jgi:acyl-CoA thioesterase
MSAFLRATALAPLGAGRFGADVDAGWAQGRGVYGGLVAALLVRAIEASAPAGHRLVRLTTSFCAALPAGPVEARVSVLRAGRNVSTMRAELAGSGVPLAATCLATLARPRASSALEHHGLVRPEIPPPRSVADGPEEHYLPAFARHFAFRQCVGPRPFSGGELARLGGWCRLREEVPLDAAALCALADAWPPAAVGRAAGWCHVASLEMTVHVLVPAPAAPGWVYFDATSDHVEGGLADERAVLYAESGTPLATVQQVISLLPTIEPPPTPAPRPDAEGR